MPTFRYAAKDSRGKTVEGTVVANDRSEVVAELRKQSLIILRIDEPGAFGRSETGHRGVRLTGLFATKPRCKHIELVVFTRQLATMIGAGLSLLESLEILGEQAESKGMKVTCDRIVSS